MINVRLKSSWGETSWFAKIDWEEFRKHWPLATSDEKPGDVYSIEGPCRLSYAEVAGLQAIGAEMEVAPLPGAMLTKMADRGHKWDRWGETTGEHLQDGKCVQITVPDQALMFIDEVTYRDDCCTDEIQSLLDEGWRIIAVCPPNAARRPDYILGRRKCKDPFE